MSLWRCNWNSFSLFLTPWHTLTQWPSVSTSFREVPSTFQAIRLPFALEKFAHMMCEVKLFTFSKAENCFEFPLQCCIYWTCWTPVLSSGSAICQLNGTLISTECQLNGTLLLLACFFICKVRHWNTWSLRLLIGLIFFNSVTSIHNENLCSNFVCAHKGLIMEWL